MMFRFGRPRPVWVAVALAALGCLIGAYIYRARGPHLSQPGPAAKPLSGGVRTPELTPVGGPRFTGANVVVISVDTLRRDHLSPYGATFETAAAARLAREGVVFEHAVSQVPLTLPSHTSIFTGLYPPHHTVRDNGGFVLGQDTTTLAERFQAAGYKTAGFVSSYVLHSRWGIGQGHETYDDFFDYAGLESRPLTDVERPAGPVVDAALAWLRQPQRDKRPFYLWVHLYDPHRPYEPPEEYRAKGPDAVCRRGHVRRCAGERACSMRSTRSACAAIRWSSISPTTASRSATTASRPTASSCTERRSMCR